MLTRVLRPLSDRQSFFFTSCKSLGKGGGRDEEEEERRKEGGEKKKKERRERHDPAVVGAVVKCPAGTAHLVKEGENGGGEKRKKGRGRGTTR